MKNLKSGNIKIWVFFDKWSIRAHFSVTGDTNFILQRKKHSKWRFWKIQDFHFHGFFVSAVHHFPWSLERDQTASRRNQLMSGVFGLETVLWNTVSRVENRAQEESRENRILKISFFQFSIVFFSLHGRQCLEAPMTNNGAEKWDVAHPGHGDASCVCIPPIPSCIPSIIKNSLGSVHLAGLLLRTWKPICLLQNPVHLP